MTTLPRANGILDSKDPDVDGCPAQLNIPEFKPADWAKFGGSPGHLSSISLDAEATKTKRAEPNDPDSCCYTWMEQCPGGRPLLDARGQPRLAELVELEPPAELADLPPELREQLARAWLADARMEHSSIASFLRVRAELEAVGAPAELLEACEAAANDERRHAARCFELAATYGRACAPSSLPELAPRDAGLIGVAIDTFIEGCVGETIAAASAHRAARDCTDPRVARVLAEIAHDESEHAALAWRTLAWAVAKRGAPVLAALRETANQLRPSAPSPVAGPNATALATHGRLDRRALAELRQATWTTIIDPMLVELAA